MRACHRSQKIFHNLAKKNGRLFTLIELLIVIAVISILASMLLPALKTARMRGKSILCSSNLKQIYLAIDLYKSDNNGYYPVSESTAGSGGTVSWYYRLCKVVPPYILEDILMGPLNTGKDGTGCPDGKNLYYTYGINQELTLAHLTPRETQITNPSQKFCVADVEKSFAGTSYWRCKRWNAEAGEWVTYRHLNGENLVFCDGHVDWMKLIKPLSSNNSIW